MVGNGDGLGSADALLAEIVSLCRQLYCSVAVYCLSCVSSVNASDQSTPNEFLHQETKSDQHFKETNDGDAYTLRRSDISGRLVA